MKTRWTLGFETLLFPGWAAGLIGIAGGRRSIFFVIGDQSKLNLDGAALGNRSGTILIAVAPWNTVRKSL
jgi:hypothetical protein